MEASKKRKGAPGSSTPSTSEGSASKKLKLLNSNHSGAPKTKVQELGQKLLHQLQKAVDKTGRSIVGDFQEVPTDDVVPGYSSVIKLPVALSTIEQKIKRNAYPTMTTLESDLKRMVQNAKDFNDPSSVIYGDAERIRKLVFNFMKINNPEYSTNPNYTSFATPIPQTNGALLNGQNANGAELTNATASREASVKPGRSSVASKTSEAPSDRKTSVAPSATPGVDDDGVTDIDFTGKSFQQAQADMISYLINYTDEEGLQIYTPFGNLPSRSLEDYYQVIKHPVSLKGMAKKIKGIHGRQEVTGVTDYKTWDAFEEEASFIWRNAKTYNEDGSDMFILANEFEEHFKSLIAEAREKVEEPAGTRIKLAGPKPKVTLNLSQHRNSPAPGVSIDNDALARQRQAVAAGVNGHPPRPPSQPNGAIRTIEPRPNISTAPSGSPVTAVKAEHMPSQSPAPHTIAPLVPQSLPNGVGGMMPPPSMRPPSGSPFPPPPPINSYTFTAPSLLPAVPTRTSPAEQALLPAVTLSTHPHLSGIPKRWSISIPPHPHLSHQSTTLTLPSTHYFLQISPTISKGLSMGRPYKMFVTLNGTRLNQRDTQFHADSGKRTHVYEGSLAPGVNRIEVEVAAQKADGSEKGLETEKVTVYASLTKS
ncbi:Bromodomain-containing protein [Teratosphaeria nubilosa]|uniref:Bromodomain-containing protein n=1 Tax=Teratosphaeria nubilosa TaxID=161662 RepID=A0A6G1LGJ9_9PEZI|nr:Bromodomain-containing protein [Teratosphaeria nubilosa]